MIASQPPARMRAAAWRGSRARMTRATMYAGTANGECTQSRLTRGTDQPRRSPGASWPSRSRLSEYMVETSERSPRPRSDNPSATSRS